MTSAAAVRGAVAAAGGGTRPDATRPGCPGLGARQGPWRQPGGAGALWPGREVVFYFALRPRYVICVNRERGSAGGSARCGGSTGGVSRAGLTRCGAAAPRCARCGAGEVSPCPGLGTGSCGSLGAKGTRGPVCAGRALRGSRRFRLRGSRGSAASRELRPLRCLCLCRVLLLNTQTATMHQKLRFTP